MLLFLNGPNFIMLSLTSLFLKDLKEKLTQLSHEQKTYLESLVGEPLNYQDLDIGKLQLLIVLTFLGQNSVLQCLNVLKEQLELKWETSPEHTRRAFITDFKVKMEFLLAEIHEDHSLLISFDQSSFNDLNFKDCLPGAYTAGEELFDRIIGRQGLDEFGITKKKNYLEQLVANFIRATQIPEMGPGMETHYGVMFYNLICEEYGLLKKKDIFAPNPTRISPEIVAAFLQKATANMDNVRQFFATIRVFRSKLPAKLTALPTEACKELLRNFTRNKEEQKSFLWAFYPDLYNLTFPESASEEVFSLMCCYTFIKMGWMTPFQQNEDLSLIGTKTLVGRVVKDDLSQSGEYVKPLDKDFLLQHFESVTEFLMKHGVELKQFSIIELLEFYKKAQSSTAKQYFLRNLLTSPLTPENQEQIWKVCFETLDWKTISFNINFSMVMRLLIKEKHNVLFEKIIALLSPSMLGQLLSIRTEGRDESCANSTYLMYAIEHKSTACALKLLELAKVNPLGLVLQAFNSFGDSALNLAIKYDERAVLEKIFAFVAQYPVQSRKQFVFMNDASGLNVESIAARYGNIYALRQIRTLFPFRMYNGDGSMPIQTAARLGVASSLKAMLPIYNATLDDFEKNKLLQDVFCSGNKECIEEMLQFYKERVFAKPQSNTAIGVTTRYNAPMYALHFAPKFGLQHFEWVIDQLEKFNLPFARLPGSRPNLILREDLLRLAKESPSSMAPAYLQKLLEKQVVAPVMLLEAFCHSKSISGQPWRPADQPLISLIFNQTLPQRWEEMFNILLMHPSLMDRALEFMQQHPGSFEKIRNTLCAQAPVQNFLRKSNLDTLVHGNYVACIKRLREMFPDIYQWRTPDIWQSYYLETQKQSTHQEMASLIEAIVMSADASQGLDHLLSQVHKACIENTPLDLQVIPSILSQTVSSEDELKTSKMLLVALKSDRWDILEAIHSLNADFLLRTLSNCNTKQEFADFLKLCCKIYFEKNSLLTCVFDLVIKNNAFVETLLTSPLAQQLINQSRVQGASASAREDTLFSICLNWDKWWMAGPSEHLIFRLMRHPGFDFSHKHLAGNSYLHLLALVPSTHNNYKNGLVAQVYKELVQHIDVNATNEAGETVLSLAVKHQRVALIDLLIQHPQIRYNLCNHQNQNILHALALSLKDNSIRGKQKGYKSIQVTLKRSVPKETLDELSIAKDDNGNTPEMLLPEEKRGYENFFKPSFSQKRARKETPSQQGAASTPESAPETDSAQNEAKGAANMGFFTHGG